MTVSNAIGTAMETKYIDFEPRTAAIAKTHVFAASSEVVFSWKFRSLTAPRVTALDGKQVLGLCIEIACVKSAPKLFAERTGGTVSFILTR